MYYILVIYNTINANEHYEAVVAEPELSTRFVWESGLIPRDLAHCPRRRRRLGG